MNQFRLATLQRGLCVDAFATFTRQTYDDHYSKTISHLKILPSKLLKYSTKTKISGLLLFYTTHS